MQASIRAPSSASTTWPPTRGRRAWGRVSSIVNSIILETISSSAICTGGKWDCTAHRTLHCKHLTKCALLIIWQLQTLIECRHQFYIVIVQCPAVHLIHISLKTVDTAQPTIGLSTISLTSDTNYLIWLWEIQSKKSERNRVKFQITECNASSAWDSIQSNN